MIHLLSKTMETRDGETSLKAERKKTELFIQQKYNFMKRKNKDICRPNKVERIHGL